MTIQTRLTLYSVLVMTAIIAIISALDLANQVETQFTATLERAQLLERMATIMVRDTLNRNRSQPWRQSLLDKSLKGILPTDDLITQISTARDDLGAKKEDAIEKDKQKDACVSLAEAAGQRSGPFRSASHFRRRAKRRHLSVCLFRWRLPSWLSGRPGRWRFA